MYLLRTPNQIAPNCFYRLRVCGSSQSLSPSPIKLIPKVVKKMALPGMAANHQRFSM